MSSRLFLVTFGILSLVSLVFTGVANAGYSVVPEIDGGSASAALAILVGGLALLRERFRK